MTVSVSNHPIAVDSTDNKDNHDARRHAVHMAICAVRSNANTPVDACCMPARLIHSPLLSGNRLSFPLHKAWNSLEGEDPHLLNERSRAVKPRRACAITKEYAKT